MLEVSVRFAPVEEKNIKVVSQALNDLLEGRVEFNKP